jgi:hypothetical protein
VYPEVTGFTFFVGFFFFLIYLTGEGYGDGEREGERGVYFFPFVVLLVTLPDETDLTGLTDLLLPFLLFLP